MKSYSDCVVECLFDREKEMQEYIQLKASVMFLRKQIWSEQLTISAKRTNVVKKKKMMSRIVYRSANI